MRCVKDITRVLQSLDIPNQAWTDIIVDFMEHLPRSEGKDPS